MKNLYTSKNDARRAYIQAKKEYMEAPTSDNWIAFCKAKRNCMLLGIII